MLMSRTGVQATWLRDRPRQELERLGGADGSRIVLVSNEALSGHPHGYPEIDHYAVADNLKRAFLNARIVSSSRIKLITY
jgi:hypothetical protein